MSSHNHNHASQATEPQAQLQSITRQSSQQRGPSHVTLGGRIPTGPASRRPSRGSRQHRAMQPSTRRPSLLRHRDVSFRPRSSTYRARLNGHRNRVGHASPALNQGLFQTGNSDQSNYPSSTHSKYPPHAGWSDYNSARRYHPLDGNLPVPPIQNQSTALLVQPEGDHQQSQQDYGSVSSQLQHNGAKRYQEEVGVNNRTMPKVPPGFPEDPLIASPELSHMGASTYNRGMNVSGLPPPLLPYDANFLPLPVGSAGTHHGGSLDTDLRNRYQTNPLGIHRNYGGDMMVREANGYLPSPRGTGYQSDMNGYDANEGNNGNTHHQLLRGARPSHGVDPSGYSYCGMNQEGYHPHPHGTFSNHEISPNEYNMGGMNQNGYSENPPVAYRSYGVGRNGYDHSGTNYTGYDPHAPDGPRLAFRERMGNMPSSGSLQPRAKPNLGRDGSVEQYGNHQVSNNVAVDLRHQDESRVLLYDPDIPLPSIETDDYQEWVDSRKRLQDSSAADFDHSDNYE